VFYRAHMAGSARSDEAEPVGRTTQRSGHERATPGCRARHRMRTAPAAPRHALASGAFSPFFALCPADHHGHSLILRLRAERRPDVAPARLARPAAAREARPSCTCSSSSSSSNHIRRQAAPSCSALGSPIPVARSRLLGVTRRSVAHNDCIARLVKSVRLAEAGRSALLGGWALLGRPPTG
jgi:hypothetical protein